MLTPEFIKKFGKPWNEYFQSIDEEYKERWQRKVQQVEFTDEQLSELNRTSLPTNIVVFTSDWCSDSQNAVPIIGAMSEESDYITAYFIDSDEHTDQMDDYKIAGGKRTPHVIFMNKDFQEIERWVERANLTYELVADAKFRAKHNDSGEYKEYLRESFKKHSQEMFRENIKELIQRLHRTVALINSSASLKELPEPEKPTFEVSAK